MSSAEKHSIFNEKELLVRIAENDEAAFAELFNHWYAQLSSHIYYITRSFDLTQEIIQDVFLKIWMSREALSSIDHFKPYLWTAAKNHALNALNKIARERNNHAAFLQNEQYTTFSSDEENMYQSLIDEAIAQLPPQQQKVFLMSRRDRMKQADIAASLNITISSVKKYLQLATAFITRYVKEKYLQFCLAFALSFYL